MFSTVHFRITINIFLLKLRTFLVSQTLTASDINDIRIRQHVKMM